MERDLLKRGMTVWVRGSTERSSTPSEEGLSLRRIPVPPPSIWPVFNYEMPNKWEDPYSHNTNTMAA